ncbi:MAG: dockerin type I domain-containing protein [Ruminococcus sp.]|nr:dockerin type I domain-containing protein [Ruminococcus sp.]
MHGILGKRILGAAAAVLTALCSLTAELPVSQADYKQTEYLTWSQADERWGSTPMGNSSIRESGCLLTSLAIMIMDSDSLDEAAMKNLGIEKPEDFNPGVLAQGYSSIDGFSSGGAINRWLDVQELIPSVQWGRDAALTSVQTMTENGIPDKAAVAEELQSMMSQGWYIIARVVTQYGGYHWVYIRGVENGAIYMAEPAKPTPVLYEVYPGGLQGEYWALKGANPPAADFVPPLSFEPSIGIEVITPPKTMYAYGEELDLSACTVRRKGIDLSGKAWEDEPVPLTKADNIKYSVNFFNPSIPGDYELLISAMNDYAYGEASVTLTVSQPVGEYCLWNGCKTDIYASELGGTPIMSIGEGCVVNVTECRGRLGHIDSKEFTGWADVSRMERVISPAKRTKGDINGNGLVNKYDMAQLNVHLSQKASLPDGISMLTAAETEAADINSDGKVDEADLIALLTAIQ